jgi:hypothetical protein
MATAMLFASIINIEQFNAISLKKFNFAEMNDSFINHDNNNLLLETMSSMNFVDNSQ